MYNVLVVGGGAIGTIVALDIESGGKGQVTMVLRSNYQIVRQKGYTIQSLDHGDLRGWRPWQVVDKVPVATARGPQFDFVIITTKNYADVASQSLAQLIAPAVTPVRTTIVMMQSGLNIEKPMLEVFKSNVILSGIFMMNSREVEPGKILQERRQERRHAMRLSHFYNPGLRYPDLQGVNAQRFIEMYNAGQGFASGSSSAVKERWRQAVFDAVMNPLCAVLQIDEGQLRLNDNLMEMLVRPAMQEIVHLAKALGHELEKDTIEMVINRNPPDLNLKPSMLQDVEKGNLIEVENLVGEPLREAQKRVFSTPTMKIIYEMARVVQQRIKEKRGSVERPPSRHHRA